jgi:hypothetical protein
MREILDFALNITPAAIVLSVVVLGAQEIKFRKTHKQK